jgi:DNA (cytosine-5)-methyltransferase 1
VNIPQTVLEELYAQSVDSSQIDLHVEQLEWVATIAQQAEQQKAVLAALITSLVKKIVAPQQDIRLHKSEFEGGYSGRVFDTQYITPFIRKTFPRLAMRSGSGWLTRSIEQAAPFDLQFPGRINNREVKSAFLNILHDIQAHSTPPDHYLIALFAQLRLIQSALTPTSLHFDAQITVNQVTDALKAHFFHPYQTSGAARLPVVAIYSIYELLTDTPRYRDKKLLRLKSHTTSDQKSGSIGDVEIVNHDNTFFEAVEIKHQIAITATMVEDAFEKIRTLPVARYYLLTTAEPNTIESNEITRRIETILLRHGCEIIVNGIMPSIKYYLRLLPDPAAFLVRYSANLQGEYDAGTDIKRVHIDRWISLNPPSSKA